MAKILRDSPLADPYRFPLLKQVVVYTNATFETLEGVSKDTVKGYVAGLISILEDNGVREFPTTWIKGDYEDTIKTVLKSKSYQYSTLRRSYIKSTTMVVNIRTAIELLERMEAEGLTRLEGSYTLTKAPPSVVVADAIVSLIHASSILYSLEG